MLIPGLRSSIPVGDAETVIAKRWFFLPYYWCRGPYIEDVWYGGDWGFEDDAMGVVVKLGGKEVHLGSSDSMRHLHESLRPLSPRHEAPT